MDAALGSSPQGEMSEFEKYKKDLMAEFTEYKKSFDLSPGKKLNFNGLAVSQSSMDGADATMFEDFSSDAGFKAISDELEADVTSGVKSPDDLMSDSFFDEN